MDGLDLSPVLGTAMVFLAVTLGMVSVALTVEWMRARRERKKVDLQLQILSREGLGGDAPGALFEEEEGSGLLGRLAGRIRSTEGLRLLLERAEVPWSVTTFFVFTLGWATALGLTAFLISSSLLVAPVAAALGGALPYLRVRRKYTRRMNAIEEQLPDAIDLLGRAIRAGYPISAGIKMMSEEAKDPLASEFRRVFDQQRFGMPFADSLMELVDRVPLVDVRIFVSALLIQREVGGNLAEILDNLSSIIRQRFTFYRQVRTITAQGRISGIVLASLPIAFFLFQLAMNTELLLEFLVWPPARIAMGIALFFQIVGMIWMRKIVDIKV